ncbi:MAG: hypothetical protein PHY82_07335 [Lentisphaeria bacterium]|nr:hypothetical protein [Lentisphaeria bacterium]
MLKFTERINHLELVINRWKVFVFMLFFSSYVLYGLYQTICVQGKDDPMLLYIITPMTVLLLIAGTILSFEKTHWTFDLHTRTARWKQHLLFKRRSGYLNFHEIERFDLQQGCSLKNPSRRLVVVLKSNPDKPFPMQRCWENKENFPHLDEIRNRLNRLLDSSP